MPKKILKLTLALGMLVGGFTVGPSVRDVSAAGYCSDICCNASCTSIRRCFSAGGGCLCRAYCEPNFGGGIER
ncbi:MAG TPA: hypothetical protein VEL74_20660 [Thermoanaerobaculia bacterium]|nr:hypothetical protein [Thermoanaerobaculia bacterium]